MDRKRKQRSHDKASSLNLPTLSKSRQTSQLHNTGWETERLKHDLKIHAIPYNERLSPLLSRYIPTLAALKGIASTSAFVAFDTESMPHCYKTSDVGFAFLPGLDSVCSIKGATPTLERFVENNRVIVASFKINGRYHDIHRKLQSEPPPRPGRPRRPMECLQFSEESFVNIEDLNSVLTNQIKEFRRLVPGKQLVLVGYFLQNDFECLSLEFPGIVEFFSGWIDLSTLIKAESPTPPKLDTGLGAALTAFRYPYSDTGFGRKHHSANDAVRTLAVLCGLMDPQNLYRALIHVNGRRLPSSIDSAQKLAFAVQKFKPIGVAADCSNANNKQKRIYPTTINTGRRTYGYVCFKASQSLHNFIDATNGQRFDGVVIKVKALPPQRIQTQISQGNHLRTNRKNNGNQRAGAPDIDWADAFRHTVSTDDEPVEERASWLRRLVRKIFRSKRPTLVI
ncbi:hypothetical protein F4825DRAFT_450243 [Nemania diffusa]|nr:hypothetical protein F4825DRAFT_450243 [Nemania diffusa]